MKTAGDSSQHALIHFIARCCQTENWVALSHLGLSPQQACRIGRLSTYESHVLGGIFHRVVALRLRFANLQACLQEAEAGAPAEGDAVPCQEAELCMQLFCHIAHLYRNNERQRLCGIGLNPEQARFVCLLSSLKVQSVSQHFWKFAVFEVDIGKLDQVIETAVGTACWFQQCTDLMRAGAPRKLMTRYYGMSCEMYAGMREMHGVPLRGRPRVLPDDLQELLYEEFMRRYRAYEAGVDPLRQPGFFLSLYESMGRRASLREIWTLVRRWISDKEAHGPSGRTKR